VLLCSCSLVWALYQVVRMTAGHLGAIVSCMLLVLSAGYLRLSVSVMLAVPSLMFVMLSVYAALRFRRAGRVGWVALSGALLALALGVKMWTAMLIPVVGLAVLAAARDGVAAAPAAGAWRRPLAWWAGGLASSLLILLMATVPLDEIGQLLRPHLDVRGARDFHANTVAFWGHYREDLAIVLLALLGAALVIRRRDRTGAVPAAWAVTATIVLAGHEPLWYHHYLMVSVPLCWLAGIGVSGLGGAVATRDLLSWKGAPTALAWTPLVPVAAAAVLLAAQVPGFLRANFGAWSAPDLRRDRHLIELMRNLSDDGGYVVTDEQVIAFRAGLRVPPELGVTSLKRRWSGHLPDAELVGLLGTYQPQLIYFAGRRIRPTDELVGWLAPRYRHVYGDPWGGVVLIRNDLAPPAMEEIVEAASRFEDCWEAQLNLAEVHARAGRDDEARQGWLRALNAMPEDPDLAPLRRRLTELSHVPE
jgi:hypothetical protein